jgi:hypothetical protein
MGAAKSFELNPRYPSVEQTWKGEPMKKRILLESFIVLSFDGVQIRHAPVREMHSPHPKLGRGPASTPNDDPPVGARSLVDCRESRLHKNNREQSSPRPACDEADPEGALAVAHTAPATTRRRMNFLNHHAAASS